MTMLTDFHGNVCMLDAVSPAWNWTCCLGPARLLVNPQNGEDLGLSSRKVCLCEVHCLERAALKS